MSISVSFNVPEVSDAMQSPPEMHMEIQTYTLICGQAMLGAEDSHHPHITYDVVGLDETPKHPRNSHKAISKWLIYSTRICQAGLQSCN